jgi:hypothetical protein
VISICLLLYVVPPEFHGWWGMTSHGALLFKQVFPAAGRLIPVSESVFVWTLRSLLIFTWTGWVALVATAFSGSPQPWSRLFPVVALLVLALAIFSPPVFSTDALTYVAYARLPARYGLNPYEYGRSAMDAAGDPTAAFLAWPTPLPYGPLWTLSGELMDRLGSVAGLYGEVIVHKLAAGVALIAAAWWGGRLADCREPGRARLTFTAIALNPLFLLEGPATGHNDFIMLALLVWGAALSARGRWKMGALALGLAAAVKPIGFGALPLLVFERWLRSPVETRWRRTVSMVALALAPTVVLSCAYGGPYVLFRSVLIRAVTSRTSVVKWISLLVLAAVTLWGLRSVRTMAARLPAAWWTAWIPLSVALMVLATEIWFPWYVAWAWLPALTAWDERHRFFTTVGLAFGAWLTWFYTISPATAHVPPIS